MTQSTTRLRIAAYDIAHPTRLQHALRELKAFSTGGQKSVFECYLSPNEQQMLLAIVSGILHVAEDRFLVITVDTAAPIITLGLAIPPSNPDFFYVGD